MASPVRPPSSVLTEDSVIQPCHPWDVAVVYDSLAMKSCGRYHDVPQICPLCQTSIVLICDGITAANGTKVTIRRPRSPPTLEASSEASVFFKYNKQSFLLSLRNPPKRYYWFDRRLVCTAQERIAYALGMNEKHGLKIICKGKVLYPNVNRTMVDISNELLNISRTDFEKGAAAHNNNYHKPSLVVMGTREGQGLHEPRRGFVYTLFAMGTNLVYTVVHYAWNVVLYMYSLVKPLPPPPPDGRRTQ